MINVPQITDDIHKRFDAVRHELISTGAILEVTESSSPLTQIWDSDGGFTWRGKDPSIAVSFPNNGVTYEYGKTVGWTFKEGRDFSRNFATDSLVFVINEAAAKFFGFENPIGEELLWNDKPYKIIGIVKDMIIESPYAVIRPQLFHIDSSRGYMLIMKLNPEKSSQESLDKIRSVLTKYSPASPFEYQFVDEDYARKFESEVRIGKLASSFATLAIFISCLGLFGMASFMAEQRSKEIGVRKILGASVFNLWSLLSKEFVFLVIISLVIAIPTVYYFLSSWLQNFAYHTNISIGVFAIASIGALLITLLTVSFQTIKAALSNPVESLRSE